MQCFRCQAENADGSRFCGNCGAQFGTDAPLRMTDPTRDIPIGTPPPASDLPQLSRGGTPDGWAPSGASLSLRVPVSRGARMVTIAIFLALDAAMVLGGVLLWRASRRGTAPVGRTDAGAPDAASWTKLLVDGGAVVVEPPPPVPGPAPDLKIDASAPRPGPTPPGKKPDAGAATPPPVPAADAAPPPPPPAPDAAPPPDAEPPDGNDDVPAQINKLAAKSRSALGGCYTRATKGLPDDQPLDGEVDIYFEVMPTGEVKDVTAVRNTTLSAELSECVISVVSEWRVKPFEGEPVQLQKTFPFHPS